MTTHPRFFISGYLPEKERKGGAKIVACFTIYDRLNRVPLLSGHAHTPKDSAEVKKVVAILNAMPPIIESDK